MLQHQFGGVVRSIKARDGAVVKKGDVILEIQPAAAKAELAQLIARRELLRAQKQRLQAEKAGSDSAFEFKNISIDVGGLRGTSTNVKLASVSVDEIYSEQGDEFRARLKRFKSQIGTFKSQYAALEKEHAGFKRQASHQVSRQKILAKQIKGMKPLAESGYIAKSQLWGVESQNLEALSVLDNLNASIASHEDRMREIKTRIDELHSAKDEENANLLTQVISELSGVEEQASAAQKAVESTEIRAPVSGTLAKLEANTVGGVIRSGDIIAEIIPSGAKLQIEAMVPATNISSVKEGLEANVLITAFNPRLHDQIPSKVSYVAADSVFDERLAQDMYTVRLDFEELAPTLPDMQSGMQAQVFITTESRSFFSYLFRPVVDSFQKSFREN